jgi:uncharacterized protein (TIGR04255 family)
MVAQVGPPIFRTWFTTEDEVYVVQLQPDRLVLNWRKRGDSYPRFEPILERFIDALLKFWSFLKSENLNPTPINQVELSYVNWIVDISPPTYLRLALETAVTSADLSGYPTEQQWGSRYIVASEVFEANLDIACVKATRSLPPANEGTQFSLAFRSLLETDDDGEAPSIDLVVDRMAKGRSLIVQTFTDLTTEAGHAIWERTQ